MKGLKSMNSFSNLRVCKLNQNKVKEKKRKKKNEEWKSVKLETNNRENWQSQSWFLEKLIKLDDAYQDITRKTENIIYILEIKDGMLL